MPIDAILFDKDGTLVDFDQTWGRAAFPVMQRMSRDDAEALERLAAAMHYDLDQRRFDPRSPLIAGSPEQILLAWGGALGRSADRALMHELNELFTAETLMALMPVGDPLKVLDALLGRGLILGLATNDTEASARGQLAALGLDGHMAFVAGYDSGHGSKPEPGMVLAFAEAAGVPPPHVAMVGDSLHDLNSARSAGAVAVAVLSGPATRAELEPHADHVIDSIADLPDLLSALG